MYCERNLPATLESLNPFTVTFRCFGKYGVNNVGETFNLDFRGTGTVRELKQTITSDGYRRVRIGDGKELVHRLVWIAFKGDIPDGMVVDHINFKRDDNRIENLQLLTIEENSSKKSSEAKKNHKKFVSRRIYQFDLKGNFIREWDSAADVERILGIDSCHISACCHGKRKSAGGSRWAYA